MRYIFHHANSLLCLAYELVLGLFNLLPGLLVQMLNVALRSPLASLERIEHQPRILDVFARLGRKHQVGVQGRVPPSQKAALDLSVLAQPGLADLLRRKGVFLQADGELIFTVLVGLGEVVRASQSGAGNGMAKGFRLGLRGRRGAQRSLAFTGRGRLRKELDFLADGATEVVEGFAQMWWVVV